MSLAVPAGTFPTRWKALVGVAIAALAIWYAVAFVGSERGAVGEDGFQEYKLPLGMTIPVGMAVASRGGAVWFTLEASDVLGVLRGGQFAFVPKGAASIEPLGLAVDPAGAVWFTEAPKQRIARMSVDGVVTSFDLTTPIARLGRLAAAADGSIWFAEGSLGSVTQLKDGHFVRHTIGPRPGAESTDVAPFGVAVAPDGVVWASLQGADALLRVTPGRESKMIEVPIRGAGLGDVAIGPDGAVWFLAAAANKIGRYAGGRFESFSVPTPNAGLMSLAVAPDGAAWFTALRGHRLGRVHKGVVTEFPLPRANARPFGIVVDADNNVWYSDLSGWIGKLDAAHARVR
jgi:virginiamycin B lyase